MTDSHTPIVSIIMATYNRPDVLKYAIESVIWQTYKDWELIVVGDACSESTDQVIKDFNNPKIRYHNFEKNFGEQSGPNNWGINNAKGDYIAFLNHDDIYFSDHLEKMLNSTRLFNADLHYSMSLTFRNDDSVFIGSYTPGSKYTPKVGVPASCWLVKKSIFDSVGEWRSFREVYGAPSQEWLYRVWQSGKKILPVDHFGVLAIPSGSRSDSYVKESSIHVDIINKLKTNSHYREYLITCAISSRHPFDAYNGPAGWRLKREIRNLIMTIMLKIGYSPIEFIAMLKTRKKGRFINHLRKNRGLIPK